MTQKNTKSTKTRTPKGTASKGKKVKAVAPKKRTPLKKKAAAKKKAPVKIDQLNYIDGKYDVQQIKDLEELVGIKEVNLWGTTSLDVLEAKLSEMNMWELQEFAVKVGVFPSGTRGALKNKLAKEFTSYNKGKGRHIVLPAAQSVGGHLSPEELKKVLELTKKGL
jgi:hypothetical protein